MCWLDVVCAPSHGPIVRSGCSRMYSAAAVTSSDIGQALGTRPALLSRGQTQSVGCVWGQGRFNRARDQSVCNPFDIREVDARCFEILCSSKRKRGINYCKRVYWKRRFLHPALWTRFAASEMHRLPLWNAQVQRAARFLDLLAQRAKTTPLI